MCASGSRISTSASVSMSRALTSPGLVDAQVQRLGRVDVHLERNLLQVEDDVGRVLDHARDRRELVQHAVDLAPPSPPRLRSTRAARAAASCRSSCRSRARTAARRSGRTDPSASRARTRAAWDAENLSRAFVICPFTFRPPDRGAPPDLPFRPPPPTAGLEWLRAEGYVSELPASSCQLPASPAEGSSTWLSS